ncbi:unnamed protein product, partial [marine sediment metagenome]
MHGWKSVYVPLEKGAVNGLTIEERMKLVEEAIKIAKEECTDKCD